MEDKKVYRYVVVLSMGMLTGRTLYVNAAEPLTMRQIASEAYGIMFADGTPNAADYMIMSVSRLLYSFMPFPDDPGHDALKRMCERGRKDRLKQKEAEVQAWLTNT